MYPLLIGVYGNRSKKIHFNHSDGTGCIPSWPRVGTRSGLFSAGINSPVFDDNEVQMMRNSLNDLLQQHVLPVDWNILTINSWPCIFCLLYLGWSTIRTRIYFKTWSMGSQRVSSRIYILLIVLQPLIGMRMPCMNHSRCTCPVGSQLMTTKLSMMN